MIITYSCCLKTWNAIMKKDFYCLRGQNLSLIGWKSRLTYHNIQNQAIKDVEFTLTSQSQCIHIFVQLYNQLIVDMQI